MTVLLVLGFTGASLNHRSVVAAQGGALRVIAYSTIGDSPSGNKISEITMAPVQYGRRASVQYDGRASMQYGRMASVQYGSVTNTNVSNLIAVYAASFEEALSRFKKW